MLRILVLSDLHLEFADLQPSSAGHDVVVLAGDIHVGMRGLDWASKHFASVPVVYVPGNHEYYGGVVPKLATGLKKAAEGTNVHVLDNDAVVIGGVRFLGSTLWTDFELFGDAQAACADAAPRISDYQKIRVAPRYSKLRPVDTRVFHRTAVAWLQQSLAHRASEPTVVVTHHAPSARSVEARYANDPLTPAFASHLDGLVGGSGAHVWIHGHLHNSSDYRIQDTRVVCNPRGYTDELNPSFRPDLVVEVP